MVEAVIIGIVLFVAGAVLLLERKALGKLAFVQPLVLCLIAGMIVNEEETALWIGISIQLLSIGQSHYCNWALVAVINSASLIILKHYGISIDPGSADSMVLITSSILTGIMFDSFINKLSHKHDIPMRSNPLWHNAESFNDFKKVIQKSIVKGLILGGLSTVAGVAISTLLTIGTNGRINVNSTVTQVVLIVVPLFGISITMASMTLKRYSVLASLGLALFFIMVVVL